MEERRGRRPTQGAICSCLQELRGTSRGPQLTHLPTQVWELLSAFLSPWQSSGGVSRTEPRESWEGRKEIQGTPWPFALSDCLLPQSQRGFLEDTGSVRSCHTVSIQEFSGWLPHGEAGPTPSYKQGILLEEMAFENPSKGS